MKQRKQGSHRVVIVGDVHGCLDELRDLLSLVCLDREKDRLIFVGDVINKGPYSYEVLKWIAHDLRAEVVLGNHELKFLKGVNQDVNLPPLLTKLKHQMEEEKALEIWMKWMKGCPFFIEDEDFLVVHAGFLPGQKLESTPVHILVGIRTCDEKGEKINSPEASPWHHFYKGKKLVVFGHWAQQGLFIRKRVIGLDSGCVYGKKLSALILPERRILSVPAQKVYCSIKNKESLALK